MKVFNNKNNNNTIRYNYLRKYELLLNQPYNWENEGILHKIMSSKIFIRANNANNKFLLSFLTFIDSYILQLLISVRELKLFKNYLYKNF